MYVQMTLKGSNTDPFRHGVKIIVGRTGDKLCPVSAIMAYAAVRGSGQGPLFKFANGKPLIRASFVSKFQGLLEKIGYPAKQYAGHNVRVGATTTVATVGIQDSLFQTLVGGKAPHIYCILEFPRRS